MAKDIIFDLINEEKTRQTEGLELIPSENYVTKEVLEAMGSVLTNKYSEGYPSFENVEYNGEDDKEYTKKEKKIAEDVFEN